MNDTELQLLDRIATALERLAPLGDYAQTMLIQARGEKVWEVGGWVLATTSKGDDCAYLYASHPGLKFRVSTVYVERFGELPFDPYTAVKKYDGEAPPTKEGAKTRGLYNECGPFKISTLPTGKVNDDGDPEHRFNRVLDATHPVHPHRPAPASSAPENNGKPAAARVPQSAPSDDFDGEFEEPAQAASQLQTPFQEATAALGEIERLAATKTHRFPGAAKPESWCILKDEVKRLIDGQEAQVQVLAYLLSAQAASVAKPDWLPNGSRCAAALDYLSAKDENGKPLFPIHVAPGRVRDLNAILALATEQPKF